MSDSFPVGLFLKELLGKFWENLGNLKANSNRALHDGLSGAMTNFINEAWHVQCIKHLKKTTRIRLWHLPSQNVPQVGCRSAQETNFVKFSKHKFNVVKNWCILPHRRNKGHRCCWNVNEAKRRLFRQSQVMKTYQWWRLISGETR